MYNLQDYMYDVSFVSLNIIHHTYNLGYLLVDYMYDVHVNTIP